LADDYVGFDVELSKTRSRQWIALGNVDRSRIGRKSYWEEQVVPRINDEAPELWRRSAEVRKALRLSTCDLAHLREAGKIEAKKVGNAYLYKLPKSPSVEAEREASEGSVE
jgi:hypothetical protein